MYLFLIRLILILSALDSQNSLFIGLRSFYELLLRFEEYFVVLLDLFEIEILTLQVASFDDQLFLSGIVLDDFLNISHVHSHHFTPHPRSKQLRNDISSFKWRVKPNTLSCEAMVEVKAREGRVVLPHL